MNKKQKILKIIDLLDKEYPHARTALAFRNPLEMLVSTILSAQCTDKRVNEVAPRLFARANTPRKMVKLTVKQIEKIIHSCGLGPAKAKAIRGLSQMLIERHVLIPSKK